MMSYSIFTVIFFAAIAFSSAIVPVFDRELNVLVRFFGEFAQLYRSPNLKSYVDQNQTIEKYQFFFQEREYVRIVEESLDMLSTNVIDRTIIYHPAANFAVNGSRYFYRRDSKQELPIEIELVNPEDRLFRVVSQPDRYLYLPAFADLEYVGQIPVTPYYEVIFTCSASSPSSSEKQSPLLSYIVRSLQYTPRYVLDLPSTVTYDKVMQMDAYADIRNTGEVPIVVKGARFVLGDVSLSPRIFDFSQTATSYQRLPQNPSNVAQPLGEQKHGIIVYKPSLPKPVTIPERTLKSIRFLETRVRVESFVYYSSLFYPVNSQGKLIVAYNLTSLKDFLPAARLLVRDQGNFLGQIILPDMPVNSTYTMILGADADVSYRREVIMLSDEETARSKTYYVEYAFENVKNSTDVIVYFSESFSAFKSFEIEEFLRPTNNVDLMNVALRGTDLRGYFLLPRQTTPFIMSYKLIVYKNRAKYSNSL